MTKNEVIHMLTMLRNPWGHGEPQLRQSRHDAAKEIERMRAELAALRADAERLYAALREVVDNETFFGFDPYYKELRDSVLRQVDAAMSAHKEQT